MNPAKTLKDYIFSSLSELKKVTWPSRKETIRYSILVTAVSVFVAIFFAILDFGLGRLVDATLIDRAQSIPAAQNINPTVTPELEALDENGNTFPLDVQSGDGTFTISPVEEEPVEEEPAQ